MTFNDYLITLGAENGERRLKLREAAQALQISIPHVHKIANGGAVGLKLAAKIVSWSHGEVTYEDLVGGRK